MCGNLRELSGAAITLKFRKKNLYDLIVNTKKPTFMEDQKGIFHLHLTGF